MELLNNQEKELLSRYNKYISNTKTQETIKYSDIFVGRHEIDVGQLRDEMKFQNTKIGIKSSSVSNRDEFKNIMSELRNNQDQKRESEKKSKNKNSQLIEDNSKQKQFGQNQKLVIKECVDKPEKQVRQKSALSQDYPELKKRSDRISSKQATMDIQKQFNEKLLQQLERLIQMKKVDSKFFFCLIKRHIEECPQFGKRVKEEIKELLNQLL